MTEHAETTGASGGTIDALGQRLALEGLLTELASAFLERPAAELDSSIQSALSEAGTFCRADRAFVYLLDEERGTVDLGGRWTAPGVSQGSGLEGPVDQDRIPRLLGLLRQDEAIFALGLGRDDEPLRPEWKRLQPMPTASMLAVPLIAEGKLTGFVGFEMASSERMWSDGNTTVLTSLAGLIVQASARSEAEQRFGLAFTRAPLGMALHAPSGRHIQVNDAYCRLTGRATEELIGRPLLEIVNPDHHREIEEKHRPLLKLTSDLLVAEVSLLKPDGSECWVRIHASAVRSPDGSLLYTVGHFEDITLRRRQEEELRDSEERFRTLVENSPAIVLRFDCHLKLAYVSPAVADIADVSPDDLIGSDRLLLGTTTGRSWRRDIASVFRTGRPIDREWGVTLGGAERWFQSRAVPEFDRAGLVSHVLVVNNDITALKESEAELAHQALHDPLTGLANRALLLENLAGALARAERLPPSVAVLFLDLDRFKLVNDSFGHGAGDGLLRAVADRIRSVVRPGDTVARLGGDEFVVLLEGLSEAREPIEVAVRLRQALAMPVDIDGNEIIVTTSIGIASAVESDVTPGGLLRDADAAMYLAKARGRDRYEIFDELLRTEATERLLLENALRRSIDRGELVVHYQPEVDLLTGEVMGAEALARWNHPERGLLDAGAFVTLAEETGMIHDIGAFVLAEACRQLSVWKSERPGNDFEVRVNLSAHQLTQPDLVDQVQYALESAGLDAEGLCLEITETALMSDPDWGLATLERLHELGLRLAIDDFGTGYSSLAYLKRFPVQVIKVDQSFVQGLGADAGDETIVRAVLGMGEALTLDVVAEGVETFEQRDELLRLGVRRVQGFLFSQAVPPGEFWAVADKIRDLFDGRPES